MVHFHAFSSFIQCCVLMEGDEVPPDDPGLYKFVVRRTFYVCVYVFLFIRVAKVVVSWSPADEDLFFFNFENFFGFKSFKMRTVEAKKSANNAFLLQEG